jgi:hypothetical protein
MRKLEKMKITARLLLMVILTVALTAPDLAKAQASAEVFGQNRVQNKGKKFEWKYFDTKHFRVYHYDKAGRQLGRYVAEEAENDISVIEKKLGGQFPKRFNIILYNSYEEYRQTNIGLKDESQITENIPAGTLNLVGDKLVVYFTGQHTDLRHQIQTGMARVVMERMVFGENFKKMVKNALLLNLPQWVTDGYIAYLVDGWDAKSNSAWKCLLDGRPNQGFYELAEQYPELAGKAFWKFISTRYGTGTVKDLLYSMQQKTSLNKALKDKASLGMKVTQAYDSCISFYKRVYSFDSLTQEKPDSTKGLIALKVPRDNTIIRNIRVSPRGSDISYVAWRDGEFTIYTQKTSKEQEQSTLLEGGQKDLTEQIDPDYPMMAWSNTGYKLAILYKKGSKTQLRVYNSLNGRIEDYEIPKNRFDRVLGMTFMEDDDKLVFSAIRKSQTDLYMFTLKGSKMTNITDDEWDDVSPVFVSGGGRTGILFLSNRPKPNMNVVAGVNELPIRPMNVFFYNTKTKSNELLQCTDVKSGHVTQAIQYGPDNFAYLYDGNGINNKYVVLFARDRHNHDSAYSVPITNYSTSILCQQYNVASGEVADVVQEGDKYRVYFHELQMPGQNVQEKKLSPTLLSAEKQDARSNNPVVNPVRNGNLFSRDKEEPTAPEIKSGNVFQSEFADTEAAPKPAVKINTRNRAARAAGNAAADSSLLTEITDSAYVKMKPSAYKPSFKPDFLSVKVDNTLLFSQYQSIAANGGSYQSPPLGGLVTISLNELLENQRITGGFQLPFQLPLPGSAYFFQYQNFTKRLDWGLVFVRAVDKQDMTVTYEDKNGTPLFSHSQLFKTVGNMVQADFSYPLDRVRSIRFHTGVRQDVLVEKVTDTLSLAFPVANTANYTSLSRLEYVFDNTISPAINIRNGTRFKFYSEYLYGLNNGNRSCYNLGFDIRNYQKIYKNFILANRLAYAHSDGNNKVEYLMGGVDNWIQPQKADGGGLQSLDGYGFQALTTPMRGYKEEARAGNNFMVLNTEFRLPVLTTFLKRPVQSPMLKNLQFVAFMDVGDAWPGFMPDASTMAQTYHYPPPGTALPGQNVFLTLTVPGSGGVALGYGAGLRTSVLGYFVRMDAAWSIDGSPKPIIYFALGTDF